MSALLGWHPGERSIQHKVGVDGPMSQAYTWIQASMPHEHQVFHSTKLPFVPITTLDKDGRPWGSIFAGSDGQTGFIKSPFHNKLTMTIKSWEGDPFIENSKLFEPSSLLIAGLGIEFSTRRRNKFAGRVEKLETMTENNFYLEVEVNEAIGNCPKYINVRELIPHPDTHPFTVHQHLQLTPDDRLPQEIIDFIHGSDTVFIGSYYLASHEDEKKFPSHVGHNQRGGRQGFIRVRPTDGRTVVLPDYSGNRLLTSLGNIEATPVASLTFVSFTTGDILYITGDAKTLIGSEARTLMDRQNVLTAVYTTGYVFVRDALPVRQRPGTEVERSPYSPPIRLLNEEKQSNNTTYLSDEVSVTLSSIEIHSDNVATFTWETSNPVKILPGQAAILDFTTLVGAPGYQHMAPWNPTSVNDDRIRTWTVSSAHVPVDGGTKKFELTMREKPGGTVTGALFAITRKLRDMRPALLKDSTPMSLGVKLVGIAGDFVLQNPLSPHGSVLPQKLLWIAGGIGLTPYLSMLSAIISGKLDPTPPSYDILFLLSTREPETLLPLISRTLKLSNTSTPSNLPPIHLHLHVFTRNPIPAFDTASTPDVISIHFTPHNGRLDKVFFDGLVEDAGLADRSAYLCGPEEFEKEVLNRLAEIGLDRTAVKREGFEY